MRKSLLGLASLAGVAVVLQLALWERVASGFGKAPGDVHSDAVFLDRVPPRPAGAITGSEFAARTRKMTGRERQRAALKQLRQGNIPNFLRKLKPVGLSFERPGAGVIRGVIWVMPDYLAIGSDQDFLRIPLSYPSAVSIAREFGCVLPTPKMVDAVYGQADCKVRPQPLPPGPRMRSSEYYLRHQKMIEQQLSPCSRDQLVAGQKKDVVLTNRLNLKPTQIAIYGWHRGEGDPIQPLSTVHGRRYADYSHGIRLVVESMGIDGKMLSILDVLQDPELASLLTYEGSFSDPDSLMQRTD